MTSSNVGLRSQQSFGATLLDNGKVNFRFWAPDRQAVDLEIEGRTALQMVALEDGWFALEVECNAGDRYRYRVDPALAVPDPASHAQDGDVRGASIVVDHLAYRWQHPQWQGRPWHETVLYELHVGVCGGFKGTMARLPALAKLGITAVELMPVADFPGTRNWGYDGVLPYAPDAAYGTPEELKALVDAAHGLGMMVFLDVVYNHFGPDGNYLGTYASSFFKDELHTPWGQAIDFRLQPVRDFFTGNLLHWLHDYRFDGLRLDAVHAISESDWLREAAAAVRNSTPPGRHIHLVLENNDNTASLLKGPTAGLYDAQWNDDGHHVLHVLLTSEQEGYYAAHTDKPAEQLARCLSEGFIFQGQAAPYPGGKPRGESCAHLPPTAFVMFLQNHDQIGNRAFGERLSVLADPQALQAAQALLLLAPSIPLIFMGEESGSTQSFLYFTDHHRTELATAVRNGRRQEFSHFSAFADYAKRELIPDPNAIETFEQSVPTFAPFSTQSELAHEARVSQLLAQRREHIMPGLPGARSLNAQALGAAAVTASWRLGNGAILTLTLNLAKTPLAVEASEIVIGRHTMILFDSNNAVDMLSHGSLPAYSLLALLEPPS